MFIKASTLVLSLVAFANAVPQPKLAARTGTDGQCSTGPIQCCTQQMSGISGLLGPITGLLGNCSPLDVLGLGSGSSCTSQPVCCQSVTEDFIGVNCSPINLSL